mgnify:FL=1
MKNKIESAKTEKELSPEEKKIAMSLESFQHLDIQSKIFLVLVWRGLKKASAVSLAPGLPQSAIDDLEKKVKKAGLFFKPTDHLIEIGKNMHGLEPGRVCFVANNQADLDSISDLWFKDHENDSNVYTRMGQLSGYPPTAVNAYDEIFKSLKSERENKMKELILSEGEKKDLLKLEPDLIPFTFFFFMSRGEGDKFVPNELEIVRKWAAEIKLITPALYQLFIENYKKNSFQSVKTKS